jgi:hypothetical protein
MTVSQIYLDRKVIDASVNVQVAKELIKKEEAKPDGDASKVKDVSYDVKDEMFKTLVSAVALSTTSIFAYTPADDVVRSGYIKK